MSRKAKKQVIDRARNMRAVGYEYALQCDDALLLRENIEEARFHRANAQGMWASADVLFERSENMKVKLPKKRARATKEYRIYKGYLRQCTDPGVDDRTCALLASVMMRLDRLTIADTDPRDKHRDDGREWYQEIKFNEEFTISADTALPLLESLRTHLKMLEIGVDQPDDEPEGDDDARVLE